MAGLTSLVQPSLEQGTFAIITLVTGIVTKVPAELSPASSDGTATFNINRQVVSGDVPIGLQDLATKVGPFWYSHSSGQIVETIDKRAFHIVDGDQLQLRNGGTITVKFEDYTCVADNTYIEGPEFQIFVHGNGCPSPQVIPAKFLDTWVKIGSTGIEAVALPLSGSFALLLMLNLLSLCFYLLISIDTFKPPPSQVIEDNITKWFTSSLAVACSVGLVYVSCFDIIRDTQCTDGEASIAAVALALFLILGAFGIVSTSNLYGQRVYAQTNVFVLFSSLSLSISISVIDYINSEEPYSLVSMAINAVSIFVMWLSFVRPKVNKMYVVYGSERALVELSIVSSLRTIVSAELGVFFAFGTGITAAILVFKLILPRKITTANKYL